MLQSMEIFLKEDGKINYGKERRKSNFGSRS